MAPTIMTNPFHIREIVLRRCDDSGENQRPRPMLIPLTTRCLICNELRRLDGKVAELTETEVKLLELFL